MMECVIVQVARMKSSGRAAVAQMAVPPHVVNMPFARDPISA